MSEYVSHFVWVKFRSKHSSGPGQWHWEEVEFDTPNPTEKQLVSWLEEKDYEWNTGSEHWRGMEGFFEEPPLKEAEKNVVYAASDILRAQARLERGKALLARLKATEDAHV